jgi:hypothetical protein
VPLWTETACRFPPKPPAGLNRNRLSETPKFALLVDEIDIRVLDGVSFRLVRGEHARGVKAGDQARLEAIASDRNSTHKTMSGRLGSCY